ncbi:MAG TPA: hypothetical protein VKD90_13615 [Gemmataceae bacterium]|nr:hypothetical protein [Gemmataceae bacterium]
MPNDDAARTVEALRQENDQLRRKLAGYEKALYAVLWRSVTPPTPEELAAAEPIGPWFDELIERLEQSGGK